MKHSKYVFAVVVVAALQVSPVFADNFLPDLQQQGEIYYLTGGIGAEETSAMESEKKDYNLQVINADKQGHFSGYPHIVIRDMQHNELLSADGGPLFYTNLPKGHYIVEGSSMKQAKSQHVVISDNKPTRVRFVWK